MFETIEEDLKRNFYHNKAVRTALAHLETQVSDDKVSPFAAARQLLEKYFDTLGKH
jgi:LAO/AO transport system kinase